VAAPETEVQVSRRATAYPTSVQIVGYPPNPYSTFLMVLDRLAACLYGARGLRQVQAAAAEQSHEADNDQIDRDDMFSSRGATRIKMPASSETIGPIVRWRFIDTSRVHCELPTG